MSSVLVGMFDTQAAAEQAHSQLTAAGFSAGQVTGSSAAGSSTTELSTASTAAHQEEGGIAGFFRSLFGSDDAVNTNDHSSTYREAFRRGGYALTVNVVEKDDIEQVTNILEDCGAVDVDERAEQWRSEGWNGYSAARTAQPVAGNDLAAGATQKVNLVEESLAVGKRAVGRGGVRVFSRVVEVPVEETVRLREEHAEVQRRVVDRPATEADFAAFKEGTIEVRNTAEEAVVAKSARVVGEVEIGKQVTEREEVVRDTVRKTEVDVEQLDGGSVVGTAATTAGFANATTRTDGSANRDPITGTPGAHPVGTGVGAIAGGVATGAAVGTVAGPIGTAVGAAVGAVAGGLVGKSVAEEVDPTIDPRTNKPL
jgi:uncharacterized protein (TIGR02271 family)